MGTLRTTTQVADLLGVPPHRVIHLVESGVVRPHENPKGRGQVRRYNRDDVLLVALALELQRWGVTVRLLQPLSLYLRRFFETVQQGGGRDFVGTLRGLSRKQARVRLHLVGEDKAVFETPAFRTLVGADMQFGEVPKDEWPFTASWVTVDVQQIAKRVG